MISAQPADSRRRLLTLTYPAISAETPEPCRLRAASVLYSSRRLSGPETWPCLPCFEERWRSGVHRAAEQISLAACGLTLRAR